MLQAATLDRIVARYPHASAFERWHMRGRLQLCPYDTLLKHLTGQGSLLDIGCGFGHLAWYLEEVRPELSYLGIDIDEKKIKLAKGSAAGTQKVAFLVGTALEMPTLSGPFGNIVILDVLYLLPWELQIRTIEWCLGKLAPGPESALIIKTMDAAKGWVGFRTLAEEWIMVHLLRKTLSSGTINGAKPFGAYADVIHSLGWKFEMENLPTWNPSSLFRIHR